METIYLVLVIVLFFLAFSDLIVGVSNDAVNFLNSAIGSKAAPFKVIMIIAALGVLVGATFSSGMMEVARKGIFHPEMFYFDEIMIIFLAVMITDVILLDLFNTMGLPTSTTVSIVFELLGAAVGVSLLKAVEQPDVSLYEYINTGKALAIISGILLSVVVAFTIGAIVQYFTRILFSFNYQKSLKYYGSLFGGLSIAIITYFILVKGAKGSSFIDGEQRKWILEHALTIVGISFVGWTVLLQLLTMLVKVNVLKVTVLVGTFALAMAFAGNDLVNFIGVPLAGFSSFNVFAADPSSDPGMVSMEALQGSVNTPTLILLAAGVVMVITLWLSKKARGVVTTSLDLSRQDEGEERFQAFPFAQAIVRGSINFNNNIKKVVPDAVLRKVNSRFDRTALTYDEGVSFDLVRASVNLVVASIIISFATSLKLPLSTTYVTFMVAMGSSFADKAWGRESAVYRISGVITVIGGWFFTAFTAFTAAFIFALIISYGGMVAIAILIILAVTFVIRTHAIHKQRETSKEERKKAQAVDNKLSARENLLIKCNRSVLATLSSISKIYMDIIEGLYNEDRHTVRNIGKEVNTLRQNVKDNKSNLYITVNKLEEQDIDSGHNYVQVVDYIRELTRSIRSIYDQARQHVDNNHKSFTEQQHEELMNLARFISDYNYELAEIIKNHNYNNTDSIVTKNTELLDKIEQLRKVQVKRIKKEKDNTKRSLLYLAILFETKNMINDTMHIFKIQQRFIGSIDENKKLANNTHYKD